MPPTGPINCERCSELEDRLLRMSQTAFDNLQKLSDAHESMQQQWQEVLSQNIELEQEIHRLQKQLKEADQTISHLEEQVTCWQEKQEITISRLVQLQDTLKQIP